jgi:maltose alpha-D-glucosyltransferase/alpha-amylase
MGIQEQTGEGREPPAGAGPAPSGVKPEGTASVVKTAEAFWYKSGVIYEVHVRAFYDADGNGTGDFRGLTAKLDYIRDLGVTAIWLLPFYPSPLRDDGYDIADYCDVHPMYGTLTDFKVFLREAHRRSLRVITELVLNHTSDQHPWFQRARRAKPGSRWRNFYVWSDRPDKYHQARIIFKDVEISNWTGDHTANAYFWHRFFFHQPDLNFDNPEVHQAMRKVVDFWLDMGVDGLRLDAVPYLYEREDTNCENLPETHAFLKELRAHVNAKYENRMLLDEANQWPEDAVAYFGQGEGDECHMAFHFPLMPRLFMAVRMEDRTPIVDILEQTPPIPPTCQWALFLRNHDELTLEMMTDEERDYMYRMYAQHRQARLNLGIRRRLAPLLGNDRKRIELLCALLFSLPGTPVLYYGDEIGLGENIYLGDRDGVRTPMQWSSDKNAGFSRANPQSLYLPIILDPEYHYEAVNVEARLANPHSLLWWMRRLLALRKRWRALGEGKCEFLQPENRKILACVLRYEQEIILVAANLSRFVQGVELDLSAFQQMTPTELFGRTEFPVITEQPYFLTFGPHSFYWFSLEMKRAPGTTGSVPGGVARAPELAVAGRWQGVVAGKPRTELETLLASYLLGQRWFCGREKIVKSVAIKEVIPMRAGTPDESLLTFLHVEYLQGDPESYLLPLAFATGSEAERLQQSLPHSVIANLRPAEPGESGILYDAVGSPGFCKALLDLIIRRRRLKGTQAKVVATRAPILGSMLRGTPTPLEPALCKNDQRNSSVIYGNKLTLKLYRRLEAGVNPELELARVLTAKHFPNAAPVVGALTYVAGDESRTTMAVLHAFIPQAKDAREYTLDALSRYYDRVSASVAQGTEISPPPADSIELLKEELPPEVIERIRTYAESARLLGVRTAELHLALAAEPDNPDLAPEPFTPHYQRGLFESMRRLAVHCFRQLRKQLKTLPAEEERLAQRVLELEPTVVARYRRLLELRPAAKRIRIHGDCHLGQVLWTGKDFVFLDLEGDPGEPLSERRIKRSPLSDVARLVRSFHYSAYAGLRQHAERGNVPQENLPKFEPWVRYWNLWVSIAFLRGYFGKVGTSGLVPANEPELRELLRMFLLDRAVRELDDEMVRRTEWLTVSLRSILFLLGEAA